MSSGGSPHTGKRSRFRRRPRWVWLSRVPGPTPCKPRGQRRPDPPTPEYNLPDWPNPISRHAEGSPPPTRQRHPDPRQHQRHPHPVPRRRRATPGHRHPRARHTEPRPQATRRPPDLVPTPVRRRGHRHPHRLGDGPAARQHRRPSRPRQRHRPRRQTDRHDVPLVREPPGDIPPTRHQRQHQVVHSERGRHPPPSPGRRPTRGTPSAGRVPAALSCGSPSNTATPPTTATPGRPPRPSARSSAAGPTVTTCTTAPASSEPRPPAS
jgi:hypothetical protein